MMMTTQMMGTMMPTLSVIPEPTRGRESGAEVAVGVLVGAVLACLPVAIAVVVMGVRTCMRLRAAKRGRAEESEKENPEGESGGGTGRPLLPGQGKTWKTLVHLFLIMRNCEIQMEAERDEETEIEISKDKERDE